MKMAFRGVVDQETTNRYSNYTLKKIEEGLSFTDGMKKQLLLFYHHRSFFSDMAIMEKIDPYVLASNLSFFLWGSSPDETLLKFAESGNLENIDTLNKAVDYMLSNPKIERFLDTFPSQWMQLENTLAATPDPAKSRLFSIDKNNPASLQMILEPLLLFDTVL